MVVVVGVVVGGGGAGDVVVVWPGEVVVVPGVVVVLVFGFGGGMYRVNALEKDFQTAGVLGKGYPESEHW